MSAGQGGLGQGPLTMALRPFALIHNSAGVNQRDGVFTIRPNSAQAITNLHYDRLGYFSAYQQGYTTLATGIAGGARVDGLSFFKAPNGNDYGVVAAGTTLRALSPSTGTIGATLFSTYTAGQSLQSAVFQGSVYLAAATLAPQRWDGVASVTTAVGCFPLSNGAETYTTPLTLATYKNRMLYGNFPNFPSHLVLSDLLNPNVVTLTPVTDATGMVVQVNPGDGRSIQWLGTFFNPSANDDVLVILKDKGVYVLSGDTADVNSPDLFSIQQLTADFGCVSPQAAVRVGTDLLFLDENNLYSLTTTLQAGTIQPRLVAAEAIRETLSSMNLSAKHKVWAKHLPWRREVWFGIPTGASPEVDKVLVYRYATELDAGLAQGVWTVRDNVAPTCAEVWNSGLCTGTPNGVVHRWFSASQLAGVGMAWRYQYPAFHFDFPMQRKRVVHAKAWFITRAPETISIRYRWRHSDAWKVSRTQSRTVGLTGGSTWDSGLWNTAQWSEQEGQLSCIPFEVFGEGEALQFEVSSTTGSVGPIFLGITGLVEVGNYMRNPV